MVSFFVLIQNSQLKGDEAMKFKATDWGIGKGKAQEGRDANSGFGWKGTELGHLPFSSR